MPMPDDGLRVFALAASRDDYGERVAAGLGVELAPQSRKEWRTGFFNL